MDMQHNWRSVFLLAAAISLLSACDIGGSSSGVSQSGSAEQSVGANPGARPGDANAVDSAVTERPVVAETLPYAEVNEQLVYGHFAFPADMVDPLPGMIVIHERWGLDDGTRLLAEQLAGQGYVVLAVDLFGGKSATDAGNARALMVQVLENPELANENIRQAYQFLVDSGQAPSIGALGWSFGGNWALNAGLLFPDELDAAVIYYGQVPNNEDRLRPLNVPILGLFGENDRGVTVDTVTEFEQALENLGKTYEIEIYAGVGHAFADPTSSNYNPEIAGLAWARMLVFLDQYLSVDPE
jgi:carboxymethylenebutenolidase